jgi:hypothetical protein
MVYGDVMTGVYLLDETSYHFDQEKYRIIFEGLSVIFLRKKEYTNHNMPVKITIDYPSKTMIRNWDDHDMDIEFFKGLI